MRKKESGMKLPIDMILKAFNYLTILQWKVIAIISLAMEVPMYLINSIVFQVIFGALSAIAILAIIVILVNGKKIGESINIEIEQPKLVEVSWAGVIDDETPCYYVLNIPLHIDSKTPLKVTVKSINCNFMYEKIFVQNISVVWGDIFATKGMKENLVSVEGEKSNTQICPFNVHDLPKLNEGWWIKGEITFKWVGGIVKKRVDALVPEVSSDRLEKARLKNKQLYASILGTIDVGKGGE